MKAGWEQVRLDELCKIARGGSPRPIKAFITDAPDGINWIKIGDTQMGGRYIDTTIEKIKPEGIARSRYVEAGSFLLSNSMSFGRPYILRTNGCIHDGWLVLEPDYSRVDQEFLYYALSSRHVFDQFNSLAAGATVRNLNIDLVSKVVAQIPPLEEQKRIVAILDAAFEGLTRAKENAEANLQNARELFGAFLEELFKKNGQNWHSANLKDTVTDECTLSYGIVQPGEDVEGGLPVVRPTDLGKHLISRSGLKTIAPEKAEGYLRTRLAGDEILLCVRGTTGVVSKALPELEGGNVTRGIVPIRFNSRKMLQDFGYYQFRSRHIQEQIETQTYGAALRQINIRDLRKLDFSFPEIDEQERLLPILQDAQRNCETLIEVNSAKLADIADLRQSLLQKAFAGELT